MCVKKNSNTTTFLHFASDTKNWHNIFLLYLRSASLYSCYFTLNSKQTLLYNDRKCNQNQFTALARDCVIVCPMSDLIQSFTCSRVKALVCAFCSVCVVKLLVPAERDVKSYVSL